MSPALVDFVDLIRFAALPPRPDMMVDWIKTIYYELTKDQPATIVTNGQHGSFRVLSDNRIHINQSQSSIS